jgi:hypothetical protein
VDGFRLSPGITPFLTDLFVVGVPIALGVGYLLGRSRGSQTALGASALALGAVKLFTDYPDVGDDIVAIGALLAGLAFLAQALRPDWVYRVPRSLFGVGAVVLLLVGAYKIRTDFYDPFDLLVADLTFVGGLAAAFLARRNRRSPSPPTGDRSDGPERPATGPG